MRVDKSWQARICMRVFSTLMFWSNENKSCMRVDKSWQARVCMRVFSTLMSWSNENKSCMRVDKSWQVRVCMKVFSTLMSWSNEKKICTRVEKGEVSWPRVYYRSNSRDSDQLSKTLHENWQHWQSIKSKIWKSRIPIKIRASSDTIMTIVFAGFFIAVIFQRIRP